MTILTNLRADLEALDEQSRARALSPRKGTDFSSNDYLALASSERLARAAAASLERGVPIGSGGSRLLRGNHAEHEALEAEAADFFGAEAALFFPSGFTANTVLFATLPQRGDLVVHDELIHASAREGMRLGRAECAAVAHSDADAFEDAITRWRRAGGTGRPWIAVESLYSMDGDQAPLDALLDVAERHEAMLIIDEAHATGVFSADGRGLAHQLGTRENVVTLHTCGKAMGCEGALITGPRIVRDFIVNRGRGFIFSTAPSPLIASAVRESLRILVEEPERRDALWVRIAAAEALLGPCGVKPTGSQILPLVLGDDRLTMRVAAEIQAAGLDVRGIRPPTVPVGTSRLRISLTLNVDVEDIEALAESIGKALR